jgi:GT2 family glycosyltransferase
MNAHIKILILNWNGSEFTNQCLASIEKLSYDNYSTMVIDNGSIDDSITNIHTNYPSVDVLALDQNYGFASAYNLAFKHLENTGSELILILNNDTTVEPDLLDQLMCGVYLYGPEHLFCPIIHYLDSPNKIWYAGGKVDLTLGQLEHVGLRQENKGQFSEISHTGFITGCCILASLQSLKILGGFDEVFNMYAEDVDLCLRAKALGIDSIFVPEAKIYHKVSASIGGEFSIMKLKRKLLSIKKLMSKHCSTPEMVIGYSLYLIRTFFLGIFYSFSLLKK